MVLFNYSTKELTAKIVYYGPGLCGKTTNLQYIFDNLPPNIHKGKMLSLATKTDRTLFFDFLPIDLGTIRGMRTRLQLYTVPGQVFYNTTRKLVLKGADGLVFVADSQKKMLDANIESFRNMEQNLQEHGMDLEKIPHVLQFNKRDLKEILGVEELNSSLNKHNMPIYEGVATTGIGVQDTLKAVTRLVLNSLRAKYADGRRPAAAVPAPKAPAERPAPPPSPAPVQETPPAADAEPVLEVAPEAAEAEPVLEPAAAAEVEPVLELAEEVTLGQAVTPEAEPVLAVAGEEPVEPLLEVAEEAAVEADVEEASPLTLDEPEEADRPLAAEPAASAVETVPFEEAAEAVPVEVALEETEGIAEQPVIEETPVPEAEPEAIDVGPTPLEEGTPDGATVAIDVAAAGEALESQPLMAPDSALPGEPAAAASNEASFPLALDIQGQTVQLKVTITVRVEKN